MSFVYFWRHNQLYILSPCLPFSRITNTRFFILNPISNIFPSTVNNDFSKSPLIGPLDKTYPSACFQVSSSPETANTMAWCAAWLDLWLPKSSNRSTLSSSMLCNSSLIVISSKRHHRSRFIGAQKTRFAVRFAKHCYYALEKILTFCVALLKVVTEDRLNSCLAQQIASLEVLHPLLASLETTAQD